MTASGKHFVVRCRRCAVRVSDHAPSVIALAVPGTSGGVVVLTPASRKRPQQRGMEMRSDDPSTLVLDVPELPADHVPVGVDPDYWQALTTAVRFTRRYWCALDGQAMVLCSRGHTTQISRNQVLRLKRTHARAAEALV